ncbi:phospholipid carrier-dependent glycosyltransferase [Moheibacter sediminis]|uniref:Dolichyl-phosphate-mannose-protein mannosyltransferase n=1 Tax=Moheibacter sediminis TaxID=1434700 RepID=A0A1W1Y962_9FLAO|nr:phospholipid carrier-dependent glycosyltransferase [Moheibacter sediminis]SMC32702.1 Dolichyl-phosphate-mannose-protein mannosyltransferase [Moheibacter sediminis]
MERQHKLLLIGSTVFLIVLYLVTMKVPFFWDAVSKSVRATWLYNNNFSQFVVPTEFNSGHPPLWESLLALSWKIGGRTIAISRFLLLVFNIAAFWQLIRFIVSNKNESVPYWALILVLIEPALLTQTTIINNDIMLLFFTLLGLNSIYKNQRIIYTIALTGVLFSNLRGSSIFVSLLLIDFLYYYFKLKEDRQKFLWTSYLPPLIIFTLFLTYQQSVLGWFLKAPGHQHRQISGIFQMVKNTAAIGKGFLETGRIFLFLPLGFLILKLFKSEKWVRISNENKRLIITFSVFFCVFSGLFIVMTNPVGPRYYMICFLIATLFFLNLVFGFVKKHLWKKALLTIAAIGFLTGHLWIWPATISQAWDTTFAYLHYFPLKNKMQDYVLERELDKTEVGTNLNLNEPQYIDLKTAPLTKYSKLDLSKNKYVILSNIENETSDEDINTLRNTWKLEKSFSQLGVFVNLYSRPDGLE